MVCDRLKKINDVHNINLHTLGSFCDFEPGYSPEGPSSISFLEDNKTYVIMDSGSKYHHFLINLMMPALMVLEEVSHKGLHFVLCNLNMRPLGENFDNLLVELLEENNIRYTEVDNSKFTYINAKNFIPINGADLDSGVPLLYNYFLSKYNVVTETPNKKIYISRKNYSSPDIRVDNEEILENYFIEKGFQIVYPEDIPTFKEQFELFNSCSTLAALSGSGLTSLMFLQENQKVVEILTEVMVGHTISDDLTVDIVYGIHDHYRYMALLKNHTYLAVLNSEKQAELIKAELDKIDL
jgi:capsular polysaccharide biosynthesis protein